MRRIALAAALLLLCSCASAPEEKKYDNQLIARGYETLARGSQWLERGCFKDAGDLFTLAYTDFQASDHLPGMARALNNLAVSLLRDGQADKAELFASRALDISKSLGDRESRAVNLSVLGGVALAHDNPSRATDLLDEALGHIGEGSRGLRARILNDLGVALMRAGKMDEARKRLEEARELAPDSAAVQLNLGRLACNEGLDLQAENHYKNALRMDREKGYTPGLAQDLTELGRLYLRTGKKHDAAEALGRALALRELMNQSRRAEEIREELARAGLDVPKKGHREDLGGGIPPGCR